MSSAELAGAPRARFTLRSRTGTQRVEPNRWVVAGLTALWMSLFLLPTPGWTWVAIPVCALGMLVLPERPVVTTAIVIATSEFLTLQGAKYGEIEMLLPALASLHWLGRRGRPMTVGIAAVVLLTLTSVQRAPSWFSAALSGLLVYGFAWAFGALIRRRTLAATEAVRASELVAALDIELVSSDAATDERRRVAAGVVARLRDAIAQIATTAADARGSASRSVLSTIARDADLAVTRLHEELGMLVRDAAGDDPPSGWWQAATLRRGRRRAQTDGGDDATHGHAHGQGRDHGGGDDIGDTAHAAPHVPGAPPEPGGFSHLAQSLTKSTIARIVAVIVGTVLMLVAAHVLGGAWYRPAFLVPALLLPLAVCVARRMSLVAGFLGVVAFATGAVDVPHEADALLASGAVYFLLCWQFACEIDLRRSPRVQWRPILALTATTVAAIALATHHGRAGVGFISLMTILAVSGASAWAERDHVTQREEARAAQLVARAAAVQVEAVRTERQRFARELHDIVSHALVGISLQAQVAAPAPVPQQREALEVIADVAATATTELSNLVERVEHQVFDVTLVDLLERGRRLGLDVTAEFDGPSANDPLAFRMLREGLTNAARYAPGAAVAMRAVEVDGVREVSLRNGAPDAPDDLRHRSGRGTGLASLTDAVTARGGTFTARHTEDGFLIEARYPARHAPSTAPGRPSSSPLTHTLHEEDA